MEKIRDCYNEGQECPILCITKSILFVFITVFVLYLPLGDPDVQCITTAVRHNNSGTVCCLCDIHKFLLKMARRTIGMTDAFITVVLDSLYELKLKFYVLLDHIDRNDLCRSVCCSEDQEEKQCEVKEEKPHAPCRCRSKCKRRS